MVNRPQNVQNKRIDDDLENHVFMLDDTKNLDNVLEKK